MPAPRIVTLTLNPSIDIVCETESVRPGHKLRTGRERQDPGGGGINVARVVRELGGEAMALVLSGGVTGRFLENLLREAGLPHRSLPIEGHTRINQTVQDRTAGTEYRFVATGPTVREAEWIGLLGLLSGVEADWVVASGSLPPGIPDDFYARAAMIARAHGQRFVLDTSGEPLGEALAAGVTLVKPSLRELEAYLGHGLPDAAAQDAAALALARSGAAEIVALTMGGDGAVLATAEGVLRVPALPVPVRGTVGAGDSFVAGLTLSLSRGESPAEALGWAVATGAAAVASEGTARPQRAMVERLRQGMCREAG
ncbi:1-phosphofructokinase family hexose kinase [Roseomonas sp. NAR14]|uniref:Phosphofructokinase n=1 Tax=Roseomonas acroporae TaxID=2937791 RepID=A0A9X1YBB8_9PROT|nr:1-phosphofructokinase family hexose kinase [Roseomonas acroporae]MCK8785537.1 1-phosphofructokinase family hexose kinase [Roseomonas acroporae]